MAGCAGRDFGNEKGVLSLSQVIGCLKGLLLLWPCLQTPIKQVTGALIRTPVNYPHVEGCNLLQHVKPQKPDWYPKPISTKFLLFACSGHECYNTKSKYIIFVDEYQPNVPIKAANRPYLSYQMRCRQGINESGLERVKTEAVIAQLSKFLMVRALRVTM